MTLTDILIVLATVSGPILAVQSQKWIERSRERRNGQMSVFYWLMATRATRLAPEHVQALNKIELEFRGRSTKEKAVRDAWRLYADKLNERFPDDDPVVMQTWASARDSLFTELVYTMSKCLGFDFDRVQIMRGAYYPRGHGELEERQRNILIRLERLLGGDGPSLPMRVTEIPTDPDLLAAQIAAMQRTSNAYDNGSGALKVCMVADTAKKTGRLRDF